MSKISLSENDILYICVSTQQNIVNLYPITYLANKLKNLDSGKLYIFILSSQEAIDKKWTGRLLNLIKEKNIECVNETVLFENKSISENAYAIEMAITKNYSFEDDIQFVINYGGGLKQFTPALWDIPMKFKRQKVSLIYPDKFTEKLLWREFHGGKTQMDIPGIALELDFSSAQIMSLSTDNIFNQRHVINSFGNLDITLLNEIEEFPDFYSDNDLKDFLYEVTSIPEKYELEKITADTLFDIINSDKEIKKTICDKVLEKFNKDFKSESFKLRNGFVLDNSTNPLTEVQCKKITLKLKDLFLSKGFYHYENRAINLSNKSVDKLKLMRLNPPNTIKGKVNHSADLIKNLFINIYPEITDHGKYFEYYCLSHVHKWALNNVDILHEVVFNGKEIKENKAGTLKGEMKFEIDITIYTKRGNIYFIECKTFDFNNDKFLSSLTKALKLGGVFTKYYVVLPPIPSVNSTIKDKVENEFIKHKGLLLDRPNVTIAQLCKNGDLPIHGIIDFDAILRKII